MLSRYLDANLVIYSLIATISDMFVPNDFSEAINCPDSVKWKKAMADEIELLHKNKTRILLHKPDNKKLVACKWVYRIKKKSPFN